MEDNLFFADVGELGWSLHLSAHMKYRSTRGLKSHVMTYPERICLYEGVCEQSLLPTNFYSKSQKVYADGFGFYNTFMKLTDELETTVPGFYCGGDGSGATRSISMAMSSGLHIGECILKRQRI